MQLHSTSTILTENYRTNSTIVSDDMTYRKSLLHHKLLELDCFTDETDVLNFEYVVQQSMIDPTTSIFVPTTENHTTGTAAAAAADDNYSTNNKINGVQKFGKSTIKTCQTFYYPKTTTKSGPPPPQQQQPPESQIVTLTIAAARTARQIEFLYQRHKAQQTQWIRNHDIQSQPTTAATSISQHNVSDDTTTSICSDQTLVPIRKKYYPFVVVLDSLRSAQNVGSIYRTADATSCQQVITIGITPNPCTGNGLHKVQKSSLGAELYVPTQHFSNATMALQYIDHTYPSYQIVCVETTSESIPYTDLRYNTGTDTSDGASCRNDDANGMVFIFGNEVTGVDVSFYLSQMTKLNQPSYSMMRMHDGSRNEDLTIATIDNDDELKANALLQKSSPSTSSLLLQSPLTTTSTEPTKKSLRLIEIPMYGTKNSLNVAVCVSIILYEMIRQYNTNRVIGIEEAKIGGKG